MSRNLIPLGPRSALVLSLASLVGVVAFAWPLVIPMGGGAEAASHAADAPWLFALMLPLMAGVVVSQLADGGMDAKVVALLGMLVALVAGLRVLSPGAAGLEPGFFLLVVAGFAFGPGFGFVLGALGIFAGGLMMGGIGPWAPFQMFASGWAAMGAGLLPRRRDVGWGAVALLAAYALVAALAYGIIINLWFWPFAAYESTMTFVPGGSMGENVANYARFWVLTSLAWDLVRGVLSAVLVVAFAGPLLRAFARASRRAAFGATAEFTSAPEGGQARP